MLFVINVHYADMKIGKGQTLAFLVPVQYKLSGDQTPIRKVLLQGTKIPKDTEEQN